MNYKAIEGDLYNLQHSFPPYNIITYKLLRTYNTFYFYFYFFSYYICRFYTFLSGNLHNTLLVYHTDKSLQTIFVKKFIIFVNSFSFYWYLKVQSY